MKSKIYKKLQMFDISGIHTCQKYCLNVWRGCMIRFNQLAKDCVLTDVAFSSFLAKFLAYLMIIQSGRECATAEGAAKLRKLIK